MTAGPARSARTRGPGVAAVAVLAVLGAGCADEPGVPTVVQAFPTDSSPTRTVPPDPEAAEPRVARAIATGLAVPWGIDFLPDGTALVTERDSRRVLAIDPSGEVSQVGEISEAVPEGEGGLLGIAVSPDHATDRSIYLYATTATDNRVLRSSFAGGGLGPAEVVLEGIPRGVIHDGGRLAFGPDGHLYVSTGETGVPELAQDPDSLAGKILRITTEGEPAPGNPDPGSPVWSLGHRNVQGLAFDDRGRLWASEFGAQTHDELNLVRPGGNYGWPQVEGAGGGPDFIDPVVTWPTSEASPSGLAWSDGHLWMAALQGRRLWRIATSGARVGNPTPFLTDEHGRLRTVVVAPDDTLWVATSNRDGRGDPGPDDDQVLEVELR